MSSPPTAVPIQPGRSLGFITLGASLHDILTRLKAQPSVYPNIDVSYSPSEPILSPIVLSLPRNGIRLRFDGPDQRLRLIEVLDFGKTKLSYKNVEVVKTSDVGLGGMGGPGGPNGPRFRHVYDRLLGPTYAGEYIPPSTEGEHVRGTYVLSYPGIAFSFPIQAAAWSAEKDFVSLLSSSATSPAVSMAIFDGESWPKARSHLFTVKPTNPRSLELANKGKEGGGADEVELAKIYGEGRIELIRRSSPSFWIILSETTPQDLVTELGPPDAIYRKNDRRLSIHGHKPANRELRPASPGSWVDESSDTDDNMSLMGTDGPDSDTSSPEEDEEKSISLDADDMANAECFYNYFHHGFDIFISDPVAPSITSPTSPFREKTEDGDQEEPMDNAHPTNHLVATKIIFHANIPGSYPFNRHRRSRWTIEHAPSGPYTDPLTSEMAFADVSGRLREAFKSTYATEDEERSQQRGMVLNRGWGDSPGSSCELLGGFEDSTGAAKRKGLSATSGASITMEDASLGNTELFGFPGMVFEVLKNGGVSTLTVLSTAKNWHPTLKLPKSTFPPAPAPPATYLRTVTDDFYAWQSSPQRNAKETFVLHDGPPYANGELHVGHALNKVLKDVICRFQVSQGKRVQYIPGWDCHGLPIEMKALQSRTASEREALGAAKTRQIARELATKTVHDQRQSFKSWGIMGDWDNAYTTMAKDFEMRQLAIWKEMVVKGLVYRQYKPVYWSPSSATALAEAELEYRDDHKSTSVYVGFPVREVSEILAALPGVDKNNLSAVIFTTTPWTLPANKAIAVHTDMDYCVVRGDSGDQLLIAESRLEALRTLFGRELHVVTKSISGSLLVGSKYSNPLHGEDALAQPIVHADFVSDATGSGLVHMAPGHGMDDYNVCRNLGIPAFAPVDDEGCFTGDVPTRLHGLFTLGKGTEVVIDMLQELPNSPILKVLPITHKYPIDWRTKEPVIVRATEQWFADVDGIKENALKALENVNCIPQAGKYRLSVFIEGRSQWCVSRQRAWGVPIPALYRRTENGSTEAVMTGESIDHIMKVIDNRGIEAWWTDRDDDASWIAPGLPEGSYTRGKDTMDVWFDSGTSWTLLDPRQNESPADVYFEGTDQHRGWFQSSLLTYIAHQSVKVEAGAVPSDTPMLAPFKTLITHGFVLDQDGRKMSKSLGNVISPKDIIEWKPAKAKAKAKGAGPDGLRLLVASSDFTKDVNIGESALLRITRSQHKYRVTFKWLLGVLADYNPKVAHNSSQHDFIDAIARYQLSSASYEIHNSYSTYQFSHAMSALENYVNQALSAFYFETIKDRLYTGEAHDRAAAQTVCYQVFQELCDMLAPVCPLLIEEVWSHTPAHLRGEHNDDATKPGRRNWQPFTASPSLDETATWKLERQIAVLTNARTAITSAIEELRSSKMVGSSLEVDVLLRVPANIEPHARELLCSDMEDQLANIFVVSDVKIIADEPEEADKVESRRDFDVSDADTGGINAMGKKGIVIVRRAEGEKCPRCWRYMAPVVDELCGRCERAVEQEVEVKNASSAG
ncbi:isoleucyl-tRNA synthetase [Saccharata proteae CBS 121410]|uniref:Isoleucine--tRNA ligase, mitochondrial n=1 Tax=Saccharata proteae CBS 121410 TaxID=1314787 RepID=A0A6A5YED4_9PEZI|nr:isoleucyl-tRNA synthetase [Saccharata proteae CBS 121410]